LGESVGRGKVWEKSVIPLLVRRGGCAIKKKDPFRNGADGVVAHELRDV
jgi:hypothetical protein